MPEMKSEVKTFKVNYKCDHCKKGYTVFTGITDDHDIKSILYQHRCEACDEVHVFKKTFPFISYEYK